MALWHVSKIFPGFWSAGSVNRQRKTITTTKTTEKEEVDARKEGKERAPPLVFEQLMTHYIISVCITEQMKSFFPLRGK